MPLYGEGARGLGFRALRQEIRPPGGLEKHAAAPRRRRHPSRAGGLFDDALLFERAEQHLDASVPCTGFVLPIHDAAEAITLPLARRRESRIEATGSRMVSG